MTKSPFYKRITIIKKGKEQVGDTMPSNLILDLFYNDIIIEAQVGRIDAFFMMNLIFEVSINNKQITKTSVGY